MFRYFLILALVPAIFGQGVQVDQCPVGPLPSAHNIVCSNNPCQLAAGATISLEVDFLIPAGVTSVEATLSLNEGSGPVVLLQIANICGTAITCVPGSINRFSADYEVTRTVGAGAVVELAFVAPGNNVLACGQVTTT